MEKHYYDVPAVSEKNDYHDEGEIFNRSNFDSLYHEEGTIAYKSSSISHAWREGNTPVQLKKQTRNMQKMMMANKINCLKSSQSIDNLSAIPEKSKLDLELSSTSPLNALRKSSTPEGRTLLQKACSMLDISSPITPQKLNSSQRRRGSCDSELPEDGGNKALNTSDNSGTKNGPALVSSLEQHKKMLAKSKNERIEASKNPTNQSIYKDNVNKEVPSYMRLTLAKSNKEKLLNNVGKKKSKSGVHVTATRIKPKMEEECGIIPEQRALEVIVKDKNNEEEIATDDELGKLEYGQQNFDPDEDDTFDVAKAHISNELIKSCTAKIHAAADQLVLIIKGNSLVDDLDDSLRAELLSQLSAGASKAAGTLRLVNREDERSQGEIATAAMATINQYLAKQGNTPTRARNNHFQDLIGNLASVDESAIRRKYQN